MALVQQATSIRADRSTYKHSVAHRLRLIETEGDQMRPSEEVDVVKKQLQEVEEGLREAQVVIDNLKALIAKLSSNVGSDEEGLVSTEDTSRHSTDTISLTRSH